MKLKSICKLIALSIGLLTSGLGSLESSLLGSSLGLENFYIKTAKSGTNPGFEKSPWPLVLEFNKNADGLETVLLTDVQLLRQIAQKPEEIPFDPIVSRELSTIEKSINAAFLIFSGLLIMMIHDVYDLGSEFRLLRMQGLILFFFPSDTSVLYYRCGNKEYQIASSDEPNEKELLEMKTLEEVRELCGEGSRSKPSS